MGHVGRKHRRWWKSHIWITGKATGMQSYAVRVVATSQARSL